MLADRNAQGRRLLLVVRAHRFDPQHHIAFIVAREGNSCDTVATWNGSRKNRRTDKGGEAMSKLDSDGDGRANV